MSAAINGKCGCCNERPLIIVGGAIVCLVCDNTEHWPKTRRDGT